MLVKIKFPFKMSPCLHELDDCSWSFHPSQCCGGNVILKLEGTKFLSSLASQL